MLEINPPTILLKASRCETGLIKAKPRVVESNKLLGATCVQPTHGLLDEALIFFKIRGSDKTINKMTCANNCIRDMNGCLLKLLRLNNQSARTSETARLETTAKENMNISFTDIG